MNNGAYTNPASTYPTTLGITPTPTPTTSSSFFSQTSIMTWIIIILILSIFGFNVFFYLAKGTQTFSDIFGPIIKYITGLFASTTAVITKQVVIGSATGTKAGVDIAAGAVTGGIDETARLVKGADASKTTSANQPVLKRGEISSDDNNEDTLHNALNQAPKDHVPYEADEATSSIQASKSSGKSGWCYIGEDRGFRSCIQIGENDKCMSGDIFPSQEICVNPNLRK
jgi:hypothetical protein